MEILVAILIIAVIAALAFAVMQRRRVGTGGLDRPRNAPAGRRDRGIARRDPMAAAVAEHARATDPADVVVAEQRLRAEARNVAAGLQADAHRHGDARVNGYDAPADVDGYDPATGPAGTPSAYPAAPPTSDAHLDDAIDPQTGERVDGYGDPANDPRYGDPRYDGRLAADYVPPPRDDRMR
jgi:hypothetical protein